MQIIIQQADLVRALQQSAKVIKSNTQLPILGAVVIESGEECVSFWATDMVSLIKVDKKARVDQVRRVAISLAQFLEYCQNLIAGDVVLNFMEDTVEVVQGKSRAVLPLSPVADYPDVLRIGGREAFRIESTVFEDILKQVLISVSVDESRPVLTGVLFQKGEDGKLSIVGTDGYRLSLCSVDYKGEVERDFVVPGKILGGLLRGNLHGEIIGGFDNANNQVWFRSGDLFVGIRTLSGDFPPYKKILSSGELVKVVADRDALIQAVKQMAVFAKHNANIVRWDVGDVLKMSTQASASGEGGAELDVIHAGEELAVAFNYRYLQEYFNITAGGDVEMIFNGTLAPVTFAHSANDKFIHIIMPVKLQE